MTKSWGTSLMISPDNPNRNKTILVVSARDPRSRYAFITKPLTIVGGYKVIELISDSNYFKFVLRACRFVISGPRVDFLILIGGEATGFLWYVLGRIFLKCKIILRLGGDPFATKRQRIKGALINWRLLAVTKLIISQVCTIILLKQVDVLFVVSRHLQAEMRKYVARRKHVYIVPQPVKRPKGFRLDTSNSIKSVLTVTNLNYADKVDGVWSMLQHIHNSKSRFACEFEYHILGGGTYLTELRRRISALGDSSYINVHGFVPDPTSFYREADVFLYCSELDALPNSLLEAQSFSLPILVNRYPAFSEILKEGENALFFNKNDGGDFADKLNLLLTNDALRSTLATNNYQNICADYTDAAVGRKLAICLQKLDVK